LASYFIFVRRVINHLLQAENPLRHDGPKFGPLFCPPAKIRLSFKNLISAGHEFSPRAMAKHAFGALAFGAFAFGALVFGAFASGVFAFGAFAFG
jgi:hypothetical protein